MTETATDGLRVVVVGNGNVGAAFIDSLMEKAPGRDQPDHLRRGADRDL